MPPDERAPTAQADWREKVGLPDERPSPPPTWETSDLGTAAYVKMRGLEILGAARDGGGRFRFRFADPEGRAPTLQVEFANSESRAYDAELRTLKKLCYDGDDDRRARRTRRR